MIESYIYVNGKIVADNDTKGIQKYDYQDNIHEILEQENVVEELGNIIKRLYSDRNYLKDHKSDFRNMFFTDKYGAPILLLFCLACAITAIGGVYIMGVGASTLVFYVLRALCGVSLISLVPTILYSHKKYKKENEMRLLSIEQQITEFEQKFEVELKKLNRLRSDKSVKNYDKNVTNVVVGINNKNIEEFSNITRKKQLYEFYREYLGKFKKYNNKEYLNHLYKTDFTDEDVEFVNEMNKINNNKVLAKKKK